MSKRIDYIIDDIKEQYLENDNNIPWIIGFSGGKDSTVVLTLVWRALLAIWKSHATLTLLGTQDLPTFGYNMIDPLKSWCWGSILFYPFKFSRFS